MQIDLTFRKRFLFGLLAAPGSEIIVLEIKIGPTQSQDFSAAHPSVSRNGVQQKR